MNFYLINPDAEHRGILLIKKGNNKMKTPWRVVLFISIIFCFAACASTSLEVRKKQAEAFRNLGEVYYNQGSYTAALRELLKAGKLYPEDPILYNDLGLTYMAKGKPDLAIKHFKKALELKPDYAPARNNLGTAYMDKKEWDTAIGQFKQITEDLLYITPQYPLANLGLAYYNKGDYDTAAKYYQEALELEPNFINALLGLGRTYMAMGKGAEAVATLETGVKNYPQVAQLHFNLGEAYTLSRNYKKALDAYQKVAELAPGTALSRKAQIEAQKIKNYW